MLILHKGKQDEERELFRHKLVFESEFNLLLPRNIIKYGEVKSSKCYSLKNLILINTKLLLIVVSGINIFRIPRQ